MSPSVLEALGAERYVSLTTFRRDGTAVPTPVRAAADAGRLVVWTNGGSGKVKRLRHITEVTVAPCDREGILLGEPVCGEGRVLPVAELRRVRELMRRKYGGEYRAAALSAVLSRLLRLTRSRPVALEVRLGPAAA